ncbi:MAG: hypothetical protein M3229_04315 [Actinomycetota bacterium]|nr:hypothetical protein [Actinomycetota bacterium]
MKRIFLWINFVAATLITLLVFLQAYLIASFAMGAGEGALDAHGFVGGLFIHAFELIVFLSALGAWWGAWRWIGFTFLLFFVGTVQVFLSGGEDWVGGFHGLLALVVMVMAAVIAHRGMRDLGLRRAHVEPAGGEMPPPPA